MSRGSARRSVCRTVSLLPEFALPYLRFGVAVIALFLIARLLSVTRWSHCRGSHAAEHAVPARPVLGTPLPRIRPRLCSVARAWLSRDGLWAGPDAAPRHPGFEYVAVRKWIRTPMEYHATFGTRVSSCIPAVCAFLSQVEFGLECPDGHSIRFSGLR